MGIKTVDIPVYPVGIFDATNPSFWFGNLKGLPERHPFLTKPHKQDFYCLLVIVKARGTVSVDQRHIPLSDEQVICVKPNSVFSLNINSSATGAVVCFTEDFFSLRYNNNVLQRFAFLKPAAEDCIPVSADAFRRLQTILQLVDHETDLQEKGHEKVLRSYLNILLFELDREYGAPAGPDRAGHREEKVLLFEKMVETHFVQQKTPSWYAAEINISTNYLNKLCNEHRGTTAGELIRRRVVVEAKRLLHYTSLSVAEIAYQLGFETPSYFITFFKKNTGYTPEQFRKAEL